MQSYLTLASFMSIHGAFSPPYRADPSLTAVTAIVAIRVFALHSGRSWVRRFLWISGTLYFLSSAAVITFGSIAVVCESAGVTREESADQGSSYSATIPWRMRRKRKSLSRVVYSVLISRKQMPWYLWISWLPT